jgi:hypothetical protein
MNHTPKTATPQSWTGQISDSICGATHKKMNANSKEKLTDRECTLQCIQDGAKFVFVNNGHVIQIENQDFAGLPEHAGHTAEVSGVLTGASMKITAINIPAKIVH